MLEQYKILGAMLALGEFTTQELAEHTGVIPNTVHTVVKREMRLLEHIGFQKTKKRGGQHKQYRVKPERIEELSLRLRELYQQIPPALTIPEKENPEKENTSIEIPLGLLVAEDSLEHEYESAQSLQEKKRLIETAELDLKRGKIEVEAILSWITDPKAKEGIQSFLAKLSALMEMRKADLAIKQQNSNTPNEAVRHIDKAASLLQAWHAKPPNRVAFKGLGERARAKRKEVCLIDGINTEPDLLTGYVSDVLREHNIPIQKSDWHNLKVEFNDVGMCVVTVDSSQPEHAIKLCESIFEAGSSGEKTAILDLYADDELRNLIIGKYQASYQSYARQLRPESIVNYLHLDIEDVEQNEPRATFG